MRARILVVVAVWVAAGLAPSPGQEPVEVSLVDQSWPPYFVQDSDLGVGFARELLETCLERAGYVGKFARIPVDQVLKSLRSGLVDVHVLSRKEGREAYLWYGDEPMFSDGYRPVVRSGSGITVERLEDLDGLRLGHLEGLRYSDWYLDYVVERRRQGNLTTADSNEAILTQLLTHQIDAFVSLESTTRWMARDLGVASRIEVLPFEVKTSQYFAAVAKASRHVDDPQGLLRSIDQCLAKAREDGTRATLLDRYGMSETRPGGPE